MSRTLFAVVGAGASYDAASSWDGADVKPPLVKELFDRTHQGILAGYPLAQSAAAEIRDALDGGLEEGAVSLEHHLRSAYRDAADPYDKRRFYSITLYLQDLLWQASQPSVHFDNTDRLVATLLRHFDHVCFITLNYDTILDQALMKLDPLEELADYIRHDRWSLVKLHGSVDWGYGPSGHVDVDDPPADLAGYLISTIKKGRPSTALHSVGYSKPPRYIGSSVRQTKLFPALTVPVGEEDEIVCPDRHQAHLDRLLRDSGELDLLILGYSAYDRTVIQKIADSQRRIRSLMVVNADKQRAREVVKRLRSLLPGALNGATITASDQPFGAWVRNSLRTYAEAYAAD